MVREDLFLEDVGDLPKSEYVECASNVDDEKSTVPLGIGFCVLLWCDVTSSCQCNCVVLPLL